MTNNINQIKFFSDVAVSSAGLILAGSLTGCSSEKKSKTAKMKKRLRQLALMTFAFIIYTNVIVQEKIVSGKVFEA